MEYQPRKSSKKWLEGAPDYILAVYDKKTFIDRYTILFGKPFWSPEMGRKVLVLCLSEGGHAVSFFMEYISWNRKAFGKKIKWNDLSKETQQHIINRAEEKY